ncbi:MAG: polysaccharide pyruvyl transferase family protein [Chitinispirillaceae bacterium]|nr:polysaccharide pyruvyl transferase family protein [Chitinispirillaceae bacterium]
MGKKSIALIGASPFIGNRGVGALSVGALTLLGRTFPDAELFILDDGRYHKNFTIKVDGRDREINLIDIKFSFKLYLSNNVYITLIVALIYKILPLPFIKFFLFKISPSVRKILELEKIYSISGGDSFSDIYGIRRIIDSFLCHLLFVVLKKRYVLLPQTLGPFKSLLSRKLALFVMKKADAIFSRDNTSKIEMEKVFRDPSLTEKIDVVYDVAFLLEPVKPTHWEEESFLNKKESLIGFNISGLLYEGGYTRDNQFNLAVDYRELINSILDFFVNEMNVEVLITPHVFGNTLESDIRVSRKIFEEKKDKYGEKLHFIDREFNQNEIKYVIGKTHFFIGSRMHACIAAISQSIPAVPLAYSRKFIGVYETVGMKELVIDLREYTIPSSVIEVIKERYNKRKEYRETLLKIIPTVKEKMGNILKEMR